MTRPNTKLIVHSRKLGLLGYYLYIDPSKKVAVSPLPFQAKLMHSSEAIVLKASIEKEFPMFWCEIEEPRKRKAPSDDEPCFADPMMIDFLAGSLM